MARLTPAMVKSTFNRSTEASTDPARRWAQILKGSRNIKWSRTNIRLNFARGKISLVALCEN